MNLPGEEDFVARREQLAAQIARQRTQLASAYQDLEKPIRYTEYGMKGFGFLRQNPWVVAAVPAIFSIVTSAFGWKKQKVARSSEKTAPTAKGTFGRMKQIASTGVLYSWQLYQLYRRLKTYIP